MFFYMVTGVAATEGEALAQALGSVRTLGRDAESVHVLILGMTRAEHGWIVQVKIVVEPRLKPPPAPAVEMPQKAEAEKSHEVLIHFYAHAAMREPLEALLLREAWEPHPYVHIIEEGKLWDEAINFYPDVAFYEAAHPSNIRTYETGGPETQLALGGFVGRLKACDTAGLECETVE